MKEKVLEFLKNHPLKLCSIATVNSTNTPQNTLVGYAITDELKILINTNLNTRKWTNIKNNPRVAIVFGWSFNELNVQYEGIAELIDLTHPEYLEIEEFFFTQNPQAEKFKSPGTRFIKVSPRWVRLMDPTTLPPTVEERIM